MIISHRGNINKPNNLIEAIKILEIDVIFRNNIFLVARDYDNMKHDTLEIWELKFG